MTLHRADRREWTKPEVKTIRASSAEGSKNLVNCDNSGTNCGANKFRS